MEAVNALMIESAASDTPFCLFACSNEPHTPWNKGDASIYPPEKVVLPPYIVDTPKVREDFSAYLAEITYYDGQVGEILALLEENGLSENTLVMVVSEQGNAFPFAKWTCYGNGLQSAMIVRWPGQVEAGAVTDALVEYCDVVPTFVVAAGGTPASVLDGKSLIPVLKGDATRHKDYVYGEVTTRGIINGTDSYPIRTVRGERFRLIWNLNPTAKYTNACTRAEAFQSMIAKATAGDAHAEEFVSKYHFRPEFELFDCNADPLEMNNVAGNPEYAKVVTRLKGKLDDWMTDQGDQGIQTELEAIYHAGNAMGKSKEEVDAAWAKKNAK
jgi:N-sulfoglucosamine sulfohydrolase